MTAAASDQLEIASMCDDIKQLLLDKNAKYGNSALDPIRIFSKSTTIEQLLVRIDDKLSRIQRGAGLLASDEDVINDLIGYLYLLKIAKKRNRDAVTYQNIIEMDDNRLGLVVDYNISDT